MDFVNIILLLGAAQGLLLTVLIFQKYGRLLANHFLSAMMFFYSIILLSLLFSELGYSLSYPHVMLIPLGLPFLIGPLHYLYARYLIHPSGKLKKVEWLHFLPFILYEIYLFPDFFSTGEAIFVSKQMMELEGLPVKSLVLNWVIVIQGLTYMVLTVSILKTYSRNIKQVFSTIEKIKLNWLRNITYMVIVVLIIFLIENIFLFAGINLSHFFNLSSLLFAVTVYLMGYLGLLKSEIFAEPAIAQSISQLPGLGYHHAREKAKGSQKAAKKYEKSGLSPETAREYLKKLLTLMKEAKLYTNSNLTLTHLAEILAISPHNLSEVINTQLEQNFFDFVNQFRIEQVKKDLTDPNKQHLKILAIAFDAGFNSKTSFNTIFKKHTNMTPSEYRKHAMRPKSRT